MYKGIEVYMGRTFAEKSAVLPNQVRRKIECVVAWREHHTINGASIILAELCGVLLGLRRAEHLATSEKNPNHTTVLCFRNLAGVDKDLADDSRKVDIAQWAKSLSNDDIIRVRLCYAKHKRHRVAHEVIASPGFKLMSIARWIKVVISLRLHSN